MSDVSHNLFAYVRQAGRIYGVEDFAIFLYALVQMHKPKLVVELGSGTGACSLLCAHGVSQNGFGKVISYDNGSQWHKIRLREELIPFFKDTNVKYHDFLNELSSRFSVSEHIKYLDMTFPPFPTFDSPIDILFADYESGHRAVASIVAYFLPRMATSSSIFIDSASTSWSSFLLIEKLIGDLNHGKIPADVLELSQGISVDEWVRMVHTRRFTLVHLTKQAAQQNSTTWIKVEPIDNRPYPATTMR